MINSKTLGIMAIFAASVLVTGASVAAPSYASSNHKDKDGVSGDGNTITKEKNEGKAIASGIFTEAENKQLNCLTVYSSPCIAFGFENRYSFHK